MKYLLGIDNGGTFSKAALFDENGCQITCVSVPTELIMPKPGYMERDMEQLWQINAQAVRQVMKKSGINAQDVAGISFSGHGKGLYLWGKEEKPVMRGILSTDTRAWEYPEKWKRDGTADAVYEMTFQDILACQPVSLLAWLKDHTSAGNMEWFINNLMSAEKKEIQCEGGSVYDISNSWVKSVSPEESDLIFLPFLNGSNVNPLAKGTFIGLTAFHNRKHMLRAVYEGIVFSHAIHIERLLKNCSLPETIRLAGGAANSKVWVQIFADVLQIPIETIENKELGAQGAAMAAGIGVGIYKDYSDAIEKTVRVTNKVMCNRKNCSCHEQGYASISI